MQGQTHTVYKSIFGDAWGDLLLSCTATESVIHLCFYHWQAFSVWQMKEVIEEGGIVSLFTNCMKL